MSFNAAAAAAGHALERVTFTTSRNASCSTSVYTPQVVTGAAGSLSPNSTSHNVNPFEDTTSSGSARDFAAGDVARVMDFSNLDEEPPSDGSRLLLSLEDLHGQETGLFPERSVCLRGGYLFYSEVDHTGSAPPLGVVPLARTSVEFPPGGRRVFRGHASSDAKNGYEFVVRHDGGGGERQRPPVYLVADTLQKREEWASAIRIRAEIRRTTTLRPGGVGEAQAALTRERAAGALGRGGVNEVGAVSNNNNNNSMKSRLPKRDLLANNINTMAEDLKAIDGTTGIVTTTNNNNSPSKESSTQSALLKETLAKFAGSHTFSAASWVDEFYQQNTEFDAPKMCRTIESYQSAVKQGLRGAVLEQYEYFVEASGEMTTMGRELQALKSSAEGQVRSVDQLKGIRFADVLLSQFGAHRGGSNNNNRDDGLSDSSDDDDDDDEEDGGRNRHRNPQPDDGSLSSVGSSQSSGSSDDEGGWGVLYPTTHNKRNSNHNKNKVFSLYGGSNPAEDAASGVFEIPDWLADVTGEISAYIAQCRYTDATDSILKAKTELADITSQHESLTERRLSKRQLAAIHRTDQSITSLTARMADRLTVALRRKNDALRQLSKRERADPLSELAPILSPICLKDDDTALQLLVKLGYHNDAATAYAARRSLLLMESLHERPFSSEGRLDVVINAAQLSQSFFSCLAMAVEGFLDLFLMGGGSMSGGGGTGGISSPSRSYVQPRPGDAMLCDDTSIQSNPSRKVPPGALASIVLWCDSELVKFANAFGGNRILGHLALAPPATNSLSVEDNAMLQAYEERGEFMAAKILRKKLSPTKSSTGIDVDSVAGDFKVKKERKGSINVAAQCVDQAFQFASENLDSIGLPLVPRLAECLRNRLHGCEAEIAEILQKRWSHYVFDWFTSTSTDDDNTSQRRAGRNTTDSQPSISTSDTHEV